MLIETRRYMRTLALLSIMATVAYAGLVVVPDFLLAAISDIVDPIQTIPRLYLLAVFLLSLSVLQKPARSPRSQRVIRGILEGSLVAYCLVAWTYFLTVADQSSDLLLHWVVLYLVLCVIGPVLSGLGAALYLLFPRVSRTDSA